MTHHRPPIPVVLVVGDMSRSDEPASRASGARAGADGSALFGKPAWDEIARAFREKVGPDVAEAFPEDTLLSSESPDEVDEALAGFAELARSRFPNSSPFPIPVPFDQGDEREQARRASVAASLLERLSKFDVWAVIACGPAGHTHALLYEDSAPLRRLSRPVFVTVDSTIKPVPIQTRPHLLHLMPSNFQQAEAIVTHLRELNGGPEQIRLLSPRRDLPYVDDLYQALMDRISLTDMKGVDMDEAQIGEGKAPIVYIGYYNLDRLRRIAAHAHPVILTDGCFRAATLDFIEEQIENRDDTRGYEDRDSSVESGASPDEHGGGGTASRDNAALTLRGCRPNRSPEQYAREAFLAIRSAYREAADVRDTELTQCSPLPAIRETLRSRVADLLVNANPNRYSFADAVNRKAGFSIDTFPADIEKWRRRLARPESGPSGFSGRGTPPLPDAGTPGHNGGETG